MTTKTITRRSWLARVAAVLFACPAAKSATNPPLPFYGTLTSDHPMAPDVDVRDQYGNVMKLVRAVNVEEGWIDQYIEESPGKIKTILTSDECKAPNVAPDPHGPISEFVSYATEFSNKNVLFSQPRRVPCAGMTSTIPVRRTYGKFTIHRRVK